MDQVVTCGHQVNHHATESSVMCGQEVCPSSPRAMARSSLIPALTQGRVGCRRTATCTLGERDAEPHTREHMRRVIFFVVVSKALIPLCECLPDLFHQPVISLYMIFDVKEFVSEIFFCRIWLSTWKSLSRKQGFFTYMFFKNFFCHIGFLGNGDVEEFVMETIFFTYMFFQNFFFAVYRFFRKQGTFCFLPIFWETGTLFFYCGFLWRICFYFSETFYLAI
jgi:hypothetical protein